MTAGIVLAGGAGRRYGQPKATVVMEGQTLVERAVAALGPWCAEVVVVSRPEIPLPNLDARLLHDRPGPDCPLNALVTGLASVTADEVLVLACDLPGAAPVVGRLVAEALDGDAVVAVDDRGWLQPLCGRYRRIRALTAGAHLLARGENRLLALLEALDVCTIEATATELVNLNTPA